MKRSTALATASAQDKIGPSEPNVGEGQRMDLSCIIISSGSIN